MKTRPRMRWRRIKRIRRGLLVVAIATYVFVHTAWIKQHQDAARVWRWTDWVMLGLTLSFGILYVWEHVENKRFREDP